MINCHNIRFHYWCHFLNIHSFLRCLGFTHFVVSNSIFLLSLYLCYIIDLLQNLVSSSQRFCLIPNLIIL